MQFLPMPAFGQAIEDPKKAVADLKSGIAAKVKNGKQFGNMLASFIEEGRMEYGGRPSGFPALEENTGTIGNSKYSLFKNALRKRKVPEESIQALETYLQNGSPLTIGKAFGILAGEGGRLSEPLEDKERDAFKMVLGKLGLSKDQTEDLLALSDDGKGKALLRELRTAFEALEGTVDVDKEEIAAVARGLDLPKDVQQRIMQIFEKNPEASFSGEELERLLDAAGKEFAVRDQAAAVTKTHMREAMNEALAAAKGREQSAPVDDARGSRRSEQLEDFMRDSVLKKTGVDDVKSDVEADPENFDGTGRDLAWRKPRAEADAHPKDKSGGHEKTVDNAASSLFQRLDAGFGATRQEHSAQARNLDTIAARYGREIFSQVEQGILQGAQNGAQRISLQLMPEELGRLTIMLSMHQGELKGTIMAENADSAALLTQQMAELKASLEEQGIKVNELEVRSELQDNRFAEQWNGHREHNLMNDSQERDRMMRLSRMRREQTGMDIEDVAQQALAIEATGLHIVA